MKKAAAKKDEPDPYPPYLLMVQGTDGKVAPLEGPHTRVVNVGDAKITFTLAHRARGNPPRPRLKIDLARE